MVGGIITQEHEGDLRMVGGIITQEHEAPTHGGGYNNTGT